MGFIAVNTVALFCSKALRCSVVFCRSMLSQCYAKYYAQCHALWYTLCHVRSHKANKTALTLLALSAFTYQNVTAAPTRQPIPQPVIKHAIKHSHEGRTHTHILPATGVRHFHKHQHNGRSHIHPYSKEIGFKHSHNQRQKNNAWANAVSHQHADRTHTHPLPKTGVKHHHKHKHGKRSHTHALPASGYQHSHQLNNKRPNSNSDKPVLITGLSINQQIDAVLNRPIRNLPKRYERIKSKQTNTIKSTGNNHNRVSKTKTKKRTNASTPVKRTSILNNNTVKKVLAYTKAQKPLKTHQAQLPAIRANAVKKHKVQRPITQVKPVNKANRSNNKKATIPKQDLTRKTTAKKTITQKTIPKTRIQKPARSKNVRKAVTRQTKQTPEQVIAGNRQFALALRYENGTGVKQNLQQAFNWYTRAAKQGNKKAQFNLASLYENGKGVAKNIPEAIRWYTTAAHNGDANAQLNLGNYYARGINVVKDIKKAAFWYKRSSDQGNVKARANLNYLIEDYNGVIKR